MRTGKFFSEILKKDIYNWWWVVFLLIFTLMLYEQGQKQHNLFWSHLYRKYQGLVTEKAAEQNRFQELKMQRDSQNDPEWIELTLMKGLGLVPEGYQKAIFLPPEYGSPLQDSQKWTTVDSPRIDLFSRPSAQKPV